MQKPTLRPGLLLVLALCSMLLVSTASAQTLYDGISGPEMLRIMKSMGFSAELSKDNAGDPLIESKSGDLNFQVFFYKCSNGTCEAIQFYSGFSKTKDTNAAAINTWNTTKRYGRAYLDEAGDSRVEMDALVTGGVSEQHIRNLASTWKIVLDEFANHIGW